ncbi:flagellar basal body P-ring protein FlgI [sulfur-oxidizing endosymbiont of Gigantopelta aegis]|uniref:flagellar basal body P-ring protein FlgI n=1 Tax=sulfur-oxidizing endosymbiont of Gigantopelta aegis TaxID=2794934 RepID=UPI0018DEAEB6|nr:flagellar basal body P-ring protein FlgI [sulfur-oxidizing endosymbiont of Gigantopelta aegis]
MWRSFCISFVIFCFALNPVFAERIKDISTVAGIRSNQLVGYGLVVGLDGSGDSSAAFTDDSMRNMLEQLGITLPPGANLPIKNVAAVTLSAELPPFTKPGQKIDVNVSSIGNSKNLRGGTLLMAPLKGADGQIYAVAQGNLVVMGLNASGKDGSSVTINIPTGGRIPNGATVEREVITSFVTGNSITLNLFRPDFTTAYRLAETINDTMGLGTAKAVDASSVKVSAPTDLSQKVSYLSMLENLTFNPGTAAAKIVVNARTGTVVIGQNVIVQPAAVSHGNLTVTITNDPTISQPPAFSNGQTVVVPKSDVDVAATNSGAFVFNLGVTLDEVVRAVNNIGASPAELVAILEALKAAGSLNAELIII